MEHLSGNELIAEFMGIEFNLYEMLKRNYNASWNELMPVVEKIESVRVDDDLYFSVEINRNGCRIYRSWTTSKDNHFGWHQTGNKLRSTYEAVVEFIKWYNKQSN